MNERDETIESLKYRPELQQVSAVTQENASACLSLNLYLAHTVFGRSFRSLAAALNMHPSTIMRRVRQVEDLRDDPLIDEYLDDAQAPERIELLKERLGQNMMNHPLGATDLTPSKDELRVLRRLCEADAFFAMSNTMENGAVLRAGKSEKPTRTAVVSREIAKSLTARDWIKLTKTGTVNIYHVTHTGRAALRRQIMAKQPADSGFAEVQSPYAGQHREFVDKDFRDAATGKVHKMRVNIRESPLTTLARKKDSKGRPFLTPELLQAGERLREDFELSQMGPRVAQNWDRFLTSGDRGNFGSGHGSGSEAAAQRLREALETLGSGLGDIVLRCCCYLEGLEAAEKRMGWSARSGKIVLRIALQRLRRFYDEEYADEVNKIG